MRSTTCLLSKVLLPAITGDSWQFCTVVLLSTYQSVNLEYMKHYNGEARRRSIAKGITWRFVASGTTMLLVYLFTGSLETMAAVGAIEVTLKLLFYYGHERIWGVIPWGVEPIKTLTSK